LQNIIILSLPTKHLSVKTKIIVYILLFINLLAYGQQPFSLSFNHLTREEGLSNNNAYYMYKDSKGFLWISTPNGLNRFDGIQCKVFKTINSGISSDFPRNIIEDKSGNLWIGSDNGLNFYNRNKNTFQNTFLPITLKRGTFRPFCVDNNGLVWFLATEGVLQGLYTFNSINQKITLICKDVGHDFSSTQSSENKDVSSLIVSTKNDIGFKRLKFKNNKIIKSESFFDGKDNLFSIKHVSQYVHQENDSTLWISQNGLGLIKLNTNHRTYKVFDHFKNSKFTDFSRISPYQHYLFVGSPEGLFIFDTSQGAFVQQYSHSPNEPNGINANLNELVYIDNEANIFISQFGNGIDFTNLKKKNITHWLDYDLAVRKLNANDNHIHTMRRRNNETWAKLENGLLVVLDKNGDIIKQYVNENLLLSDSQQRIWLSDGKTTSIIDKNFNEKSYQFTNSPKVDAWKMMMTEGEANQYFQIIDGDVFEIIEENKEFKVSPIEDLNKEDFIISKPIFYDSVSKKLFISVSWWSKFYVLEKKEGKWKITSNPYFTFQVYNMAHVANEPSKIWLCTNAGLMKMNSQTYKYEVFNEKKGLPDNVVTGIIPEKNGDYWLVTNKGISHFDHQKNSYYQYTSKDGANSKEYKIFGNFIDNEGKAYFAGTNGINIIDPKLSKIYHQKPKVQLLEISINNNPIKNLINLDEFGEITFGHTQNSFEVKIVGIEYAQPKDIKIKYFLEGSDNVWQKTNNNTQIRFNHLDAGEYFLKYQAVDINETNVSDIKTLKIVIKAPFWQTNGFRFLMIVLLAMLGYVLYWLRVGQITQKTKQLEEIKRIRAESEVRALRSQMNPHFIFNCMNTIDYYILSNKTKEASQFLGKFSQLIRNILEHSRQEQVHLKDEIKSLELYLSLEQERSEDTFQYTFDIDPKLQEKDYFLPTMLLQPFVENAILHGLRHKQNGAGQLTIELKIVENILCAKIIDNGIGREASAKMQQTQTYDKHSVGMKLTEQRLLNLAESYPNIVRFSITDIIENQETGTMIEIDLPLIEN
jgi:ligand-binding sensor domain-containing protein